ncbi:hypothetical protein [Pseudobdellovibrio sp. HCB154]|uniref:hypothetical protein n=1 Tax=Pseudobdellovibrio sp. HCB154 TaxID=3386277 RepID=UPI00391708EB
MGFEQNWEHFFPDAILSVEELLTSGDPVLLQKSKLKIALENKFLNWNDYKAWASNFYGVPVLEKLDEQSITKLRKQHMELVEGYSQYTVLNSELIPLQAWDGHLLVAGLEYDAEKFQTLPQAIFFLCSPENLSFISNTPVRKVLEPVQPVVAAVTPQPAAAQPTPLHAVSESGMTGNHVWQNLETQHGSFSEIARKNFDAYVVLRVNSNQKTELYKMDEDLEKEDLDRMLFSYDLNEENPFANVYKNHFTEQFNINQLGLKILDFKYACISAIKLGPKVVGFLVGFKTTHLSQDDITTLESISEKAV